MAEVFISYARTDRGFALDLTTRLQKLQRDTWIDWRDIPKGSEWPPEIFAAIEAADNFLFIISPDSLGSEMCGQEVARAVAKKKRIITILHRPFAPKELFPGLGDIEWFDYAEFGFEETFRRLIDALDTDRDWVHKHNQFGLRAKEWDARARHNDYLLRGMELREAIGWLNQAATIKTQQPTELQRQYIQASEEWEQEAEQQRQELKRRTAVLGEPREEVVTSRLEEEDWVRLIDLIKQRQVIPVIGPDLIRVPLEGKLVTYERYVAQQLAQKPDYKLTDRDLAPLGVTLEQATLNDVVSVCVKRRPDKWPIDLHLQVLQIVNSAQPPLLPVPAALTQLAQITDFDLFVTSTFDPMMERALSGHGSLQIGSYRGLSEHDIEDPQKAREEGRRVLYYLFGKPNRANFDFALSEVEVMRFLMKLQDYQYSPKRLFEELRERNLLLLGLSLSGDQAKTFLWLAKGRGSGSVLKRGWREYFVGERIARDLALFLEQFSSTTKVVGGAPEKFVAELYRRWSAETQSSSKPNVAADSSKRSRVQSAKPLRNSYIGGADTFPAAKVQPAIPVTDIERPWPGLSPFTEEQHDFFFGRDEETAELFRHVKRGILTVLCSKSGLGKSSLLQAGLFPRLRKTAFLPVYIRLKYDEAAGPGESQVKAALQDAIQDAVEKGDLAEAAAPAPGESLWEYLHRRRDNLINPKRGVVCPVLVFDQFEEIFTRGEGNEKTRQLREGFLTCLADLVESPRIPQDLSERLADDPDLATQFATQFDVSPTGYKVVVALRDDYVPSLDDLRNIPSLASASSRMRLKEMNGEQALSAVSKPNPELVPPEVSEFIVRFIAGEDGGEFPKPLRDMEVAPAILSLFCQELNIKRGDQPQITADLVKGNAGPISDDFYHRCVDDQPEAVQRLIEDDLVTESGYRDDIDLDEAKLKLQRDGVPGTVIDKMVDDRLLRIEEHRGPPRLELTHDVLLEPVKRSRDQRREKDAREAGRSPFWTRLIRALKDHT